MFLFMNLVDLYLFVDLIIKIWIVFIKKFIGLNMLFIV